ncbi:UDP-N-acetylmuramoyl-L-alanyl-D-glutamate--2,6-diaminopimelate ligase [Tyzzerella sp. OttesenSCG-928-J15]|nr:UDP-N-acetylmuramoyl-L-alanyl-D-glutamate--2,6-diaminopimelate ligase [Tyzzerella sp. OttesenSCG-928-J15]
MKLLDMMRNISFKLVQGDDREIGGIVIDSRKVKKGDIFICIDGLHMDGHNYIESAVSAGAAAVLVSKEVSVKPAVAVVKVENTRAAMAVMAGNFYNWPSKNYGLIGITGTNGKTSSTYFVEAVLKELGKKYGIIGTVSTRIGDVPVKTKFATSTTPDPVELQQIFEEMKEAEVDNVVMEVTSHALELNKMEGLHFAVSMFTNLTQDHLDLHGSMENYKLAKAELFKMSDISVINIDDEYGHFMCDSAAGEILTYSVNKPSNLQAKNVVYTSDSVKFDLLLDELTHFDIPIPGRFTVYNALGVIGICLAMKIPVEIIQKALKNMKGVPGRIQRIPNDKGIGVFVDYSHTPDSLEKIITSVREFTDGKIITAFGCGGDRDRTKRPIMGEISAKLSDFTVITSDNPRTENPDAIVDEIEVGVQPVTENYIKLVDRREAIFYAINMARTGDSVIIAGKGHENYQILAEGTIHFDDAEEAASALDKKE